MTFQPMLCKVGTRVPTGPGWVLEPKFDGHRTLIRVDEDYEFDIRTRTGRSLPGKLPVIEEHLSAFLPPATTVDGEVVILETGEHGRLVFDVGAVTSVMGSNRPDATGVLTFVVFDLLEIEGTVVTGRPWQERRDMLAEMVLPSHRVQLSPVILNPTEDAHMRLLGVGFEGSVAKRTASLYRPGRRSDDWLKLKPQETADVIITGFKPGQGSFSGMVGAVEFGLWDPDKGEVVPVSRCSGMNMIVRQAMTDDPDAYIGRVMEIAHMGEQASGKYRHPQFVRLRYDKNKEDCVR